MAYWPTQLLPWSSKLVETNKDRSSWITIGKSQSNPSQEIEHLQKVQVLQNKKKGQSDA